MDGRRVTLHEPVLTGVSLHRRPPQLVVQLYCFLLFLSTPLLLLSVLLSWMCRISTSSSFLQEMGAGNNTQVGVVIYCYKGALKHHRCWGGVFLKNCRGIIWGVCAGRWMGICADPIIFCVSYSCQDDMVRWLCFCGFQPASTKVIPKHGELTVFLICFVLPALLSLY